MSITVGKHYHVISKNSVARKLFLCRECGGRCVPLDFKPYAKKSSGESVSIATSYRCNPCNRKFVTSPELNSSRRARVSDTYETLGNPE